LRNPGKPESAWLRSKRSPLYLDRALAAGHRDLIVVEGVFDAAILQVRGETRAIAWVAANPSEDQIQTLVKCKIQTLTFCLDPDGAGDKGTRQGIAHLTKAGISTYAAPVLPDGLDPDEFVNRHGIAAWTAHISASIHGLRFEAQKILEECNAETDAGKEKALKAGKAFCEGMPESMNAAIDSFFWSEFRQQAGLEVSSPKTKSEELKGAIAQLNETKDPFERTLLEAQIKQEFKIGTESLRSLGRILNCSEDAQDVEFDDLLIGLYNVVEDRLANPGMTGIPSGYHALDGFTGGWQRGDLIILAARPSMGKTSQMLGYVINAAKSNYSTAVISIESDKNQVGFRMLSAEASINGNNFLRGAVTRSELERLNEAIRVMASLPIKVFDQDVSTFSQIEEKLEKRKKDYGLDLVVIDYLQLIGSAVGSNRNYELSDITRGFKELARRLGVAIVCLSQLSRAVESRTDKRPMMSDLRDSGAIESDADVILMLYRDEYYNPNTPDRGIAEVIVTKNRNGPVGTVQLLFEPEFTRFRNIKPQKSEDSFDGRTIDVPAWNEEAVAC
jgi:replicative DNA helicase